MYARAWVLAVTCGAVLLAMTAARATAAVPCWERVIADWSDNGRVDRTYPLICYREAVKRLPEDLRAYSSAGDEIDRALAARRMRPTSLDAAAAPLAAAHTGRPAGGLANLVPALAGVLVATAVGWWLVRWRRRPSGDR